MLIDLLEARIQVFLASAHAGEAAGSALLTGNMEAKAQTVDCGLGVALWLALPMCWRSQADHVFQSRTRKDAADTP